MRCNRLSFALRLVVGLILLAAAGPPAAAQSASPAPPAQSASPAPPATRAAPPPGGTVSDIRVEGVQRIEPETVRSYLLIQPGEAWDDEKIDQSLKALFATGLFADVNLSRVGNTLVVKVVENPIINRIAFEGNRKIDEKDLDVGDPAAPARCLHPHPRAEPT